MTPIKDYGLIGNCETAALINPNGGIDWVCLPAFDAGSFFGALLDDEKGGSWSLHPAAPFRVERQYLDDSAILETRFITDRGVVKVTDFFVVARKSDARFYDFTSLHPTSKLVRLVEWESGTPVELEMRVRARRGYARRSAHWKQQRATAFPLEEATLFTNAPMQESNGDLTARFRVERDRPFFAVLDYGDERPLPDIEKVRRR